MDNQHRKISGYRELGKEDIDRMNRIKSMCREMRHKLEQIHSDNVEALVKNAQYTRAEEAANCLGVARAKIIEFEMWAVRSVALPD